MKVNLLYFLVFVFLFPLFQIISCSITSRSEELDIQLIQNPNAKRIENEYQEADDRKIANRNQNPNPEFNFQHSMLVEKELRSKFVWGNRKLDSDFLVPKPTYPCGNSSDCGNGFDCINDLCQCSNNKCYIYQFQADKFIPKYSFYCGECGSLGSECKVSNQDSCSPPGHCNVDNFCHCPYGEHKGPDICIVTDIKKLIILFLGAFVVFGILGFAVLMYTCYLNYRRTGHFFWCRDFRRRRQIVPQRINPANGQIKTPAFTIGNFYQFNSSDQTNGNAESTPGIDQPSTSRAGIQPPTYSTNDDNSAKDGQNKTTSKRRNQHSSESNSDSINL